MLEIVEVEGTIPEQKMVNCQLRISPQENNNCSNTLELRNEQSYLLKVRRNIWENRIKNL
jgi:hypothetical protein